MSGLQRMIGAELMASVFRCLLDEEIHEQVRMHATQKLKRLERKLTKRAGT